MVERLSFLGLFYLALEYICQRVSQFFRGQKDLNEVNIDGKVVIVTGANAGLGKCTAIEMAKRGATVIMACRNLTEGQKAQHDITSRSKSDRVFLLELDLADLSSVRKFALEVKAKFPIIHILINNAGIYTTSKRLDCTKEGYELHFGVNHLGHFLLTNLLLSNLKNGAPSRIVTLSSTYMMFEELDMDDLNLQKPGGKTSAYRMGLISKPYNNSKFANALFSAELGNRLEGTGVSTYAVCPGFVATEVFRYMPWYRKLILNIGLQLIGLQPKQGIETIMYCALSKDCADESGQFYRFSKLYRVGNKKVNDEQELGKALWDESARLVGLKARHS